MGPKGVVKLTGGWTLKSGSALRSEPGLAAAVNRSWQSKATRRDEGRDHHVRRPLRTGERDGTAVSLTSLPLAFFAGVHVRDWTCVRKIKTGEENCDLFGFLTTGAAEPVATYHSKAMPVILTTEAERELWLSDAPWEAVSHLQRPLADGALMVVRVGERRDEPEVFQV